VGWTGGVALRSWDIAITIWAGAKGFASSTRPSLTKYRYVYSNDRVLLVDPGSRAVVQEID
jgi:uncharacterized protein DUF1236